MPTLVLRNVPEDLHVRLKTVAAAHHRSMTQEAIHVLGAALGAAPARKPPDTAETLAWLEGEVWPRLATDTRTADEIIGYDADGLPG